MNRLRTRREYALEISNLSRAGLRPDQLPRGPNARRAVLEA